MPEAIELHIDSIPHTEIATDSLIVPHIMVTQDDSTAVISIKEAYPGIEGKAIHREIQTEVWFTPLLFLLFLGYGLIFFQKRKLLFQDIKDFFTFSLKSDALKKDAVTNSFLSRAALTCMGIINISLFAFFAIHRQFTHEPQSHLLILAFLVAATTAYVWLKIGMIKLLSFIFFDKKNSFIGRKAFYSFIRITGILLIPIILLLAFNPFPWTFPVVFTGIFFCAGLFILYISKIIGFFLRDVVSLFYLILYLCTLEFLPVLIFLNVSISIVTMF